MKRTRAPPVEASSDEDEPQPAPPPVDSSPIFFHAKCDTVYAELSNLYGGAEHVYQASRMKPCDIRTFLLSLASKEMSKEEQLAIMKALQPDKRNWTAAQEAYWTTSAGVPISGILAKLIGGICNSEHFRSRFNAINELLEEKGYTVKPSSYTPQGWEAWRKEFMVPPRECVGEASMRAALKFKYREGAHASKYASLLRSTFPRELHEAALRGGAGLWTYSPETTRSYRGGDLLGKLLTELRAELVAEAEA